MASPDQKMAVSPAILSAMENLLRLMKSDQTSANSKHAWVVAFTYPKGLSPEEINGQNFATELTEESLRVLVPKLIGCRFVSSHGEHKQDGTPGFSREPVEVGRIEDARLDEKGCVVTLIKLDTHPNALWTGQLIYDGIKPEVSLFYWIGRDPNAPEKLYVDLDHVCATDKGYHDGTQVIGYFQETDDTSKQKFKIFDKTLPRIGDSALSLVLRAIKESRCTQSLPVFVEAWQRNVIPESAANTKAESTGASVSATAEQSSSSSSLEPTESAEASTSTMAVEKETIEEIHSPSLSDPVGANEAIAKALEQLRDEMVKIRSMLPKPVEQENQAAEEAANEKEKAQEATEQMEVENPPAAESAPQPVEDGKSQKDEVSEPAATESAAPTETSQKTKSILQEASTNALRSLISSIPAPLSSGLTYPEFVQPVGNSLSFGRTMSATMSTTPAAAEQTSATEQQQQQQQQQQHDYVGETPTVAPYTDEEIVKAADKDEIDTARLLATYLQSRRENGELQKKTNELQSAHAAQVNQHLDSLESFMTETLPGQSEDVKKVVEALRKNPDSPELRVFTGMAASAQQTRPQSRGSDLIRTMAMRELGPLRGNTLTTAPAQRYAPYPQPVANSAFARQALAQPPSFVIGQQQPEPVDRLAAKRIEIGLSATAFSGRRATQV